MSWTMPVRVPMPQPESPPSLMIIEVMPVSASPPLFLAMGDPEAPMGDSESPVAIYESLRDETTLPPPSGSQRHPIYYLKDGIIFLVENTYFKVPRHRLEDESEVFSDLFSLPVGENNDNGKTDEQAILLQQVETKDFLQLLRYLYPMSLEYEQFTAPWGYGEWISILKLGSRWMMEKVRRKAIRRLSALDAFPNEIEKIRCGRDYRYPPWVREGIRQMVTRSNPVITEAEGIYLGVRDSLRCSAARELFRIHNTGTVTTSYYGQQYHSRRSFDSSVFGRHVTTPFVDNDIESILDAIFLEDIPKRGEGDLGSHD